MKPGTLGAGLAGIAIAVVLGGCSGGSTPQSQSPPPANATPAAETARVAELNAREQDLAQREADVAATEQARQIASLQAEKAAWQQRETDAANRAQRAKASSLKNAAAGTAAAKSVPAPAVVKSVNVPAGTLLTVTLSSDLSSKTAKAGDPFEARLVSDLMVNDRRAVPAGSLVTGTITDVISGSNAIGGTPMLGLSFNHLELSDGQQIPISGELQEQGQSEKGRDAAKILGGAAAGAILGHQVKRSDSGTVIGGLLGGAVGAVVAKKTGTEVQLAAGSMLTITLGQGFSVVST